jgi:hypothetical protein
MCRNIKVLFNFDPPATENEVKNAAIQFVRKLSGFHNPSKINEEAFNLAVEKITEDAQKLLQTLTTDAQPRDRVKEAERAHARAVKRFGIK